MNMPAGEREFYWITTVAATNEPADPNSSGKSRLTQSYPHQLEVVRLGPAKPRLGIDLQAGWMGGYLNSQGNRPFSNGYFLAVQGAILENLWTIGILAANVDSKDQNGKFVKLYRVGGELNFRILPWWRLMVRLLGGEYPEATRMENNLLLDYGVGYMFNQHSTYTRVQVGWAWDGFPRPVGVAASLVRPYTKNGDSTIGTFSVFFPL
jgi:hypothetical protein